MRISEIFHPEVINAEALDEQTINITDRKGKTATAKARPDVFPMLLGLGEDYYSYQVFSGQAKGTIKFSGDVDKFMLALMEAFNPLIKAYIRTCQEGLANALGVDVEKLRAENIDGFQLDPDDPKINAEAIEKTYAHMQEKYPTGPLTPSMVRTITAIADETLQTAWDTSDAHKVFVGYLIVSAMNQFVSRVNTIVSEQVLGPVSEVIQYREHMASRRPVQAAGIVDMDGNPLATAAAELGKVVKMKKTDVN